MTKLKKVLVAGAVAALTLLPAPAMASGCPDYDNPCDIQPYDPFEGICPKLSKLPPCWN